MYFIINSFLLTGCGADVDLASTCVLEDLTVCYRTNPLSVDEHPVFSWKMVDAETQGQYQTAYEIVVAESKEHLKSGQYLWHSGKIESTQSVAVPYEGEALEPESRYYWQVSVWDKDGKKSASNEEAFFETGITNGDWSGAEWICKPKKPEQTVREAQYCMEYDVKFQMASCSGFLWGADARYYGRYNGCMIDLTKEVPALVIAEYQKEDILQEYHFSLGADTVSFNTSHHVKIDVKQKEVTVYLDGEQAAKLELSEIRDIGQIGFWTQRGAYYAYYDNICVTDREGTVRYQEDFSDRNENIFSPYYTKVEDGWVEASSGYLMIPGGEEPAPMFRKAFRAQQPVAKARFYVSALGIYELYLNGQKVGDDYFSPEQSVYNQQVYYRTYDVTKQVQTGDNAIGVLLGAGRYNKAKASWGDTLAWKGKLVITYEDGSSACIVSDASWKCFEDGPVRNDDMFMGEYYDANYEMAGWTEPMFGEEAWENAALYGEVSAKLTASSVEPVRCIQEIKSISVTEPVKGVYVYDFGQNINGFCRIQVKGEKGQVITLRYAEALNEEKMSCRDDAVGTIWTENLYTADNTDYYICSGKDMEIYEPSLVCRGFRYVQITGVKEALPADGVTAMVLSSDLERTGYFVCSDEQINQLYNSIYWTQIDNFVNIPTDCPQRDERFGWAGDAQVFEPTAAYNADVYQFMRQYVTALRLGQDENGIYPELVPSSGANICRNGWSDAGIILVWRLYQQYGDVGIIRENFTAMCRYMDYLVASSDGFLRFDAGYSDHNAVSLLDDAICNTAQCAYVASLLAKMCRILGAYPDEAQKYEEIAAQYKKAWQEQYINEDGSIDCWLQSAYILGLAFDLYPEELKEKGAAYLNFAVEFADYHLNTGYVATPFLLPLLCDYGYAGTAYQVLQQQTYPSWNYMFAHGATTITEAWNTFYENEDGTYGINGSLNHYGLGSVGQWLYEGILGIKPDESNPAYKHFYLQPVVGGGLTYASGSYESIYGTIVSEWHVEGQEIIFHFIIPANTSATVTLPDAQYQNMELQAGEYEFRVEV